MCECHQIVTHLRSPRVDTDFMQTPTDYLLNLAQQTAQVYITHPQAKAMLLSGSVAKHQADQYSDLDLMLYYETLPSEQELEQSRLAHGAPELLWVLGSRETSTIIQAYNLHGVQHQIVHTTIAAWEETLSSVFERFDMNPTTQKALSGMLEGQALYGEAVIAAWQARLAAYPNGLRDAMVQHHLQFFPIWGMHDYFATRDSRLWVHQIMLEAAQNILGVLAGLNRVYFSSFQLKRLRYLVKQFAFAPENLAERLELLLVSDLQTASLALEQLLCELLALLEHHMPQIDMSKLAKRIGWRQQAWQLY